MFCGETIVIPIRARDSNINKLTKRGNIFGGTYATISRVIYSLVGLAGIYLIFTGFSNNEK